MTNRTAVTRRRFNLGLAAILSGAGSLLNACTPAQINPRLRVKSYPFTLGVASGGGGADMITLWTRLAPSPLAPDGGMPPGPVNVKIYLARDEAFSDLVYKGVEDALPQLGHSIHVDLFGLEPGRTYWYRFETSGFVSPIGRTRLLPGGSEMPESVRFAQVSCQNYSQGYFSAYDHIVQDDPDFVLHLGDYIYEQSYGGNVRRQIHDGPLPAKMARYRQLHAQYKMDKSLREAHRLLPFYCLADNHDIQTDSTSFTSLQRYMARQAWYENMPVSEALIMQKHDLTYNKVDIGQLASLYLLDTRRFRDPQAVCMETATPEMGFNQYVLPCDTLKADERTLLGQEQEAWIASELAGDRHNWQIIASTVPFCPFPISSPEGERIYIGSWDGYPAARDRMMKALASTPNGSPVLLSGDVHSSWLRHLEIGPRQRLVEFTGPSVTSGWPEPLARPMQDSLTINPDTELIDMQKHGYVLHDVTPERWTAAYRFVDNIEAKTSSISTARRVMIDRSDPGMSQAAQ